MGYVGSLLTFRVSFPPSAKINLMPFSLLLVCMALLRDLLALVRSLQSTSCCTVGPSTLMFFLVAMLGDTTGGGNLTFSSS